LAKLEDELLCGLLFLKKICSSFPLVGVLILSFLLILGTVALQPTAAEVSQREEAPRQMLYQSRQTLPDRGGHAWQAIAFKRVYPDGNSQLYLRLEGVAGVTNLSRNQPLTLLGCKGQIVEAADKSSEIFPNASPAPHIRQYDLRPILVEMEQDIPLCLRLPAADGSILELDVPSTVIQEWKTVAGQE
jgi:hypothetical protein